MPFRIALSGLNAASADLGITANNIANANTYGFKESRGEFSEVYAAGTASLSTSISGSGVRLTGVSQTFSQGNTDFTNNALDLAIAGEGFFRMSDNGSAVYTRAGNFSLDREGFLVNPQGAKLQGFPITDSDTVNSGLLEDLRVVVGTSAPQETTNADIGINLPADAPVPTATPFDPINPDSYNQTTSTTVYDSLGAPHTQSFYYVKEPADNTWLAYTFIDNQQIGTPETVVFDQDGLLQTPASGLITLDPFDPGNGAAPINMTLNLNDSTQYGDQFAVNNLSQDGFTTGRLSGIDVSNVGVIFARFTNGQANSLGKVAMARFVNPGGLDQLSDTSWAESFESGDVVLGEAGTASLGLIQSGALEASNVDLTAQLVNMITAQRNFQSNAQMITTADQVTQTVLNIR
ncbi:MAG: flagellar hook protein FlgE [Gammaproteobacteria bacterium]